MIFYTLSTINLGLTKRQFLSGHCDTFSSFVDYNGLLNGLLLLHVFQSKTKYMKV